VSVHNPTDNNTCMSSNLQPIPKKNIKVASKQLTVKSIIDKPKRKYQKKVDFGVIKSDSERNSTVPFDINTKVSDLSDSSVNNIDSNNIGMGRSSDDFQKFQYKSSVSMNENTNNSSTNNNTEVTSDEINKTFPSKVLEGNSVRENTVNRQEIDKSHVKSKPDFLTRFTGTMTKDELNLVQYRCELSDNLAKQADLRSKEKKLRNEIKKLLKKSNLMLSHVVAREQQNNISNNDKVDVDVVGQSGSSVKSDLSLIGLFPNTIPNDLLIQRVDCNEDGENRMSNTKWAMSSLHNNLDQISSKFKFSESDFVMKSHSGKQIDSQ
jgi:hypothetical protein